MITTSAVDETPAQLQELCAAVSCGGLRLPNRFAMAPMTRARTPNGIISRRDIDYYHKRAETTIGLVITEGALLRDPAAGFSSSLPRFYGDDVADGWKALVNTVHSTGTKIVPQLWHTGVQRGDSPDYFPEVPSRSPSGLDTTGSRVGDPMTTAEIDVVIADYAHTAQLAKEWGFDGIELHGAHGYLLDEFLWERTNHRTDRYGRQNRRGVTFPVEVVRAVKASTGSDFPLIYRFSQWKVDNYDARLANNPTELAELLEPLASAGVDVFHASTRRHWLPAFDGSSRSLSGWTKDITGLPTIAVGSVGVDAAYGNAPEPEAQDPTIHARRIIDQFEANEYDVIAIGRALLTDAQWLDKTLRGDYGSIRRYSKVDPSRTKQTDTRTL